MKNKIKHLPPHFSFIHHMIKNIFLAVCCALLVSQHVAATIGVDLYKPYPTSAFQCLKANGVNFIITRAYHSYGAVDTNAMVNVNNAYLAGIAHSDLYMFPCPLGKNATKQVEETLSGRQGLAGGAYIGTVWLDIETGPTGAAACAWSVTDFAANCAFLTELITALHAWGANAGVYSSHYEWLAIFGTQHACPVPANVPLWYAAWNGKQDFNDWNSSTSFGSWATPSIKQWSPQSPAPSCGVVADSDFYP